MERKIDFAIIGAQKAGTHALSFYLEQHRDIFMPETREMVFFTSGEFHGYGEKYLNFVYRGVRGETRIGAADSQLIYHPPAAERLQAHNPDMAIVALLRDPIERAYSAYWYGRQNGYEPAPTFEEALEREGERARASAHDEGAMTYLAHGRYAEQMKRYFETFGRDRVLVLLSEDLRGNTAAAISSTLVWLGLPPDLTGIDVEKRINETGAPRSLLFQRLSHGDSAFKTLVRRLTSPRLRYLVRSKLIAPLESRNIKHSRRPPMPAATRRRLAQYYRPHNAELSALIGRDLDSWR